jgi:Type IV secretory system Conjugative DNA transfer
VLRWEPAAAENTVAFNPLAEVRLGTEFEYRDTANIIESLADPQGQGLEGHWEHSGLATVGSPCPEMTDGFPGTNLIVLGGLTKEPHESRP